MLPSLSVNFVVQQQPQKWLPADEGTLLKWGEWVFSECFLWVISEWSLSDLWVIVERVNNFWACVEKPKCIMIWIWYRKFRWLNYLSYLWKHIITVRAPFGANKTKTSTSKREHHIHIQAPDSSERLHACNNVFFLVWNHNASHHYLGWDWLKLLREESCKLLNEKALEQIRLLNGHWWSTNKERVCSPNLYSSTSQKLNCIFPKCIFQIVVFECIFANYIQLTHLLSCASLFYLSLKFWYLCGFRNLADFLKYSWISSNTWS